MRYAEKLARFQECRKKCTRLKKGEICECLEAVLPRDQNQSVGVSYFASVEHFPQENNLKRKPKQFKKELQRYGFDSFRIECLILRFVYDMSYQQIAENMHCPNRATVFYAIKDALEVIKKRGFKNRV